MNKKVLIVDDEQNILDSFKRQFRKKFSIHSALGPEEGLKAIVSQGPFAVIISDLNMPVMDGIEFFSQVKKISPDTVRIMLTGNANLENAIHAVNEGNIYRFLTKPCSTDILSMIIDQGIEQYRLVTGEKDLLEKTLKGSIKILTELLSMLNPEVFGRSARIKRYAARIAGHLNIPDIWQIETAAMLSLIGCINLPEEILKKLYKGKALTEEEHELFDLHPSVAADLISNIPRMKPTAEIIAYQEKCFDGSGIPEDSRHGEEIPLGSRILKVILDFDRLESKGYNKAKALNHLKQRSKDYDPCVLKAMEAILGIESKYAVRDLSLRQLTSKMILYEDVNTINGKVVISRGTEITQILIERLINFDKSVKIKEPIRVVVPLKITD